MLSSTICSEKLRGTQSRSFLPEQHKVKDFGGDAIPANLVPASYSMMEVNGARVASGVGSGFYEHKIAPAMPPPPPPAAPLLPGQIGGYIVDQSGAVIANAQISVTQLDISVTRTAITDDSGHWVVSGLPSGRVQIRTNAQGFRSEIRSLQYDANRPTSLSFGLSVASASEAVTVMDENAEVQKQSRRIERDLKKQQQAVNLQQRVAGVLPVRFDVPRAGNFYRFVRPLVLDEQTSVTFSYRTK